MTGIKKEEKPNQVGGPIREDTLFCQEASQQYLDLLAACGEDPRSAAAFEALSHGGKFVETLDARAEDKVPFGSETPIEILRRLGLIE